MKKVLPFIIVLISCFFYLNAFADKPNQIFYNNNWHQYKESDASFFVNNTEMTFDTPPITIQGRTLVPLRAFFEVLGATINWNDDEKKVSIDLDDTKINFIIGNMYATVNDQKKNLDVPAQIIDSRTMVPLRFISEALEFKIDWNPDLKEISLLKKLAVNDLSVTVSNNKVYISVNSFENYQVSTDNKYIILDIPLARVEYTQNIDINNDSIKKVRLGQYKSDLGRIVVERTSLTPYFITEESGKLVLTITKSNLITENSTVSNSTSKNSASSASLYKPSIISNDKVAFNNFVYYSQNDNKWNNIIYTSVGDSSQTIGSSGCGPTAISIIISSLTKNMINPIQAADYSVKNGYRTANNGTSWDLFSNLSNKYGVKCNTIEDFSTEKFKNILQDGKHLIIASMRPGRIATNYHFVVIYGFESKKEGFYFNVLDPILNGYAYRNSKDPSIIDTTKGNGNLMAREDIFANEATCFWSFSLN